jgi:DNA-directed RNA polymerase specialized sigma24 family protein
MLRRVLTTTDTDLTRAAAGREREAFEAVFEAVVPVVWAWVCRRVPERAAAEALAGRVLRRVFAELHDYEGHVPFAAWVLTRARAEARAARPRRAPLAASRLRALTGGAGVQAPPPSRR